MKKGPRQIRTKYSTNQSEKRTTVKMLRPIRDTNDSASQWREKSTRLSVKQSRRRSAKTHSEARKQKYDSKDRQRRKPAKNLSLKEGRAQKH